MGHSSNPVWVGERLEKLRRLVGEGLSSKQIAKEFGVTKSAIIGAVNRHLDADHQLRPNKTGRPPRLNSHCVPPSQPLPPEPTPAPTPASRVTFTELRPEHCRWPLWGHMDRPGTDSRFCGGAASGGSYCGHHFSLSCETRVARVRGPRRGRR